MTASCGGSRPFSFDSGSVEGADRDHQERDRGGQDPRDDERHAAEAGPRQPEFGTCSGLLRLST